MNLGAKHGIRPNTNANGSLDKDAVTEFTVRLGEAARAQTLELEHMHVGVFVLQYIFDIDVRP